MPDSLTYANVEMAIICEKEIGRRHVYTDDQTTYLWTEWVFDVRSQLNPATISFFNAVRQQGQFPARTDTIIRTILSQPRQPLVFTQNGVVVLRTPRAADLKTDTHLGPFVENVDVTRDVGGHTWVVEIRIIARVRECPREPGPVLISNRWTKTMDTDDDFLSSVVTQGECIFDSSTLIRDNRVPDQFRVNLNHPIPENIKRENVNVVAMSDGTTLRYSFRDQERHFNTAFATRIEVYQTEFFSQKNLLDALVAQGLNEAPAFIGNAGNGNVGGAAQNVANVGFGALRAQIPQFYSHILVRAWGHRNQKKKDLLLAALGMAFERVPNNRNVEFIVSRDLNGKMVEVQLTNRTGEGELGVQVVQNILAPALNVVFPGIQEALLALLPEGIARSIRNISTQEDSPGLPFTNSFAAGDFVAGALAGAGQAAIAGVAGVVQGGGIGQLLIDAGQAALAGIAQGAIAAQGGGGVGGKANPKAWYTQDATAANLPPPNSNQTRGTFLKNLVSQSLHSPCELPPQPPVQKNAFPDVNLYGR